jgi:hypothetical protein
MTQLVNTSPTQTDLAAAVQRILSASPEPLTPSKVRAALPQAQRQVAPEELFEVLRRQAAANVYHVYPKYRSAQERFWDRPMSVHVAALLQEALAEGPLPLFELRRKLPAYARAHIETALEEQLTHQRLHRHPRLPGTRGGERFGLRPPDAREYLRQELPDVFLRLEGLGFTRAQLRAAALELLHEEEWAPRPGDTAARQPKTHATPASQEPSPPGYEWTEPGAITDPLAKRDAAGPRPERSAD